MEDAISLVSNLSLSCLEHEFYPCTSPLVLAFTKVDSHFLFSEHKGPPSTKWNTAASAGKKGSNSDGDPYKPACHCWGGHYLCCLSAWCWCCCDHQSSHQLLGGTQGVTPQSPGAHVGIFAPHQITTNFLHPLAFPAECFSVSDEDLTSGTESESDSSKSSRNELGKVCTPPSDFQDVSRNPSLCVTYKDLVPMTRLFSTWLPISRVDWWHHTDFIQGQDIPLGLHPEHENFELAEGGASAKDYNCLAEGCSMQFTIKESACSHIWASHSHMGLFYPWTRLDDCNPWADPFQNWEAFHKPLGSFLGVGLNTSYGWAHSDLE